ncbi:MAG TPA: DUF2391 family protein [Thermomicrobiales bacterium]|nr:DUF2391 family protein [Thermomicrobiales bacterium]
MVTGSEAGRGRCRPDAGSWRDDSTTSSPLPAPPLLFAILLGFTPEMWEIGATAEPWQTVPALAGSFQIALGLVCSCGGVKEDTPKSSRCAPPRQTMPTS